MRSYKLSEIQADLKARGMPELSEKLKKQTGYDPVARKLRRSIPCGDRGGLTYVP